MSILEKVKPSSVVKSGQSPDVLLINTPATYQQGIISDDEEPSFGLLRLAVATEQKGFVPAYLDAHKSRLSLNQIDDILYDLKPRSVGINPTSVNVPEAQEIAELCAQKGIPVIVGGVHTSLDPHRTLEVDFPMAKVAVKGKGEHPIGHIVSDLLRGRETQKKGVYYRGAKKSRKDFGEYFPLDDLPLIDQARYVENPLVKKTIEINGQKIKLKEISLYETAGCPFECTYCATPVLVDRGRGKKPYHRPRMERILQSCQNALDLGANAVHFLDDMAFVTPRHFREFAEGVAKMDKPGGFYWRGMTRAPIIADKCGKEDLDALVKSGCWRIAIGVESGNEKMLKQIKKKINKDQVRRAVRKLREAGIPEVKAFFIMGFPGETYAQMLETQQFIMELKQLGLTDISIFQFKPYPGTGEWARLEKENPGALKSLDYVRISDNSNDNSIVRKKSAEGVWLPDDLKIADVPSKIVREMVLATIKQFYE